MSDEIFLVQQSIIEDFARKGSCIIVGRCGAYCLRNEPRLLRVYIYAPYEVRLKNCVEYFGMTGKEAVRAVNESDKAREHYHKKYIPGYQGDTLNSDLCINSAYYSIEEAAELITQAARIEVWGDIKIQNNEPVFLNSQGAWASWLFLLFIFIFIKIYEIIKSKQKFL